MDKLDDYNSLDPRQLELKGFARSMAELNWLLLTLAMMTSFTPHLSHENQISVVASMVGYAIFIIAFHYANFFTTDSQWKLAIESWTMILFISTVLWFTGRTESAYLNAYLLVLIASALTLGKLMTLLEMALICCIYFYMGFTIHDMDIFSFTTFTELMLKFTPFLLVAYLTTMLSADIQYAKKALIKQAENDELTGALNMRGFSKIFAMEKEKAKRYHRPLSIMMLDADNLKSVNDSLGHEAGNDLIKMMVSSVQGCLRSTDVLARYGGDEFIILLPETSLEHASIAGKRICTAVSNTMIDISGKRLTTTVSIGIASYPDDTVEPSELIELADNAMYESKKKGRNQVSNSRKT